MQWNAMLYFDVRVLFFLRAPWVQVLLITLARHGGWMVGGSVGRQLVGCLVGL